MLDGPPGPLCWAALGVLLSLLLASSAWLFVSDLSKYSTMYMLYMLDAPQGRCAGQPWGSSSPCSSPPPPGSLCLISVSTLQEKSHLCIPLFWELHGLSPNFHIHVSVSILYIPRIGLHVFPCSRIGRPILQLYKSLTYIWVTNWDTEHYNSVLEIIVSFLGIHKWEPAIYIGFSPSLHLQCTV